ncbi:MAG: hypothetical protein KJ587_00070, partial [Alphaproteobacteria bacterium]|nr:hypothetical protein [Alphaproteobacteria bacterium]
KLRRRFRNFVVDAIAGEDCIICAVVSGPSGSFQLNYGDDAITIGSISTDAATARDALGNQVGDALQKALGATASCSVGDWITCQSNRLPHLHYIAAEDDNCPWTVAESGQTRIPACLTIGGFLLTG